MAIQLITDSSADLTPEFQQQHNIQVVNLSVNWSGGETCPPGNTAFYEKLSTTKTLPKTAAPSPGDFRAVFDPAVSRGDTIIAVLLSSGISATVQAAHIARAEMAEKDQIFIIDSRSAAMGEQILLLEAIRLIASGTSAEDIVAVLDHRRHDIRFYAIVPDLKYLKMGGRISSGAATVGSLLNIRPIVGLEDGVVASFAKVRGTQAAYLKLIELIKQDGIDDSKPFFFGYSYNDDAMRTLEQLCLDAGLPVQNAHHCEIGSIVGTHAGPGACGVSFIRKQT